MYWTADYRFIVIVSLSEVMFLFFFPDNNNQLLYSLYQESVREMTSK